MKRSVSGLLLVAFVALAVAVPAVLAKADRQIALRPVKAYPHAKGYRHQYQAQTGQRELPGRGRARSLATRQARVLLTSTARRYGAARVSRSREGRKLSRDTELGQRVPRVSLPARRSRSAPVAPPSSRDRSRRR